MVTSGSASAARFLVFLVTTEACIAPLCLASSTSDVAGVSGSLEGWLLRTGDAVELRVTVEVVAGVGGMRVLLLLLCTIPLYMADKEEAQQLGGGTYCTSATRTCKKLTSRELN